MCPRIRRMILAAVLGVVGGAGAAFAQAPQPMPTAPGAAAPAVVAPAAPVIVAPAQPIAAAPTTGGCCGSTAPVAAATYGGCDSGCDSNSGKKHRLGGLFQRAAIGAGTANPVSCGCCASEKTFLFGGCKQFYNPGNTCGGSVLGSGCGGANGCGTSGGCGSGACGGLFSRLRGDCAISPVGTGGLSSPPCTYTSYMNR